MTILWHLQTLYTEVLRLCSALYSSLHHMRGDQFGWTLNRFCIVKATYRCHNYGIQGSPSLLFPNREASLDSKRDCAIPSLGY